MEEALSFFRAFEVWIYLLLGLGALIYVRKFVLSWQELRGAGFGLERENAQGRLNQSASMLVLILTMAVTEFVLVSFIAPAIPGVTPILTPTLNLLATPTATVMSAALPDGTPVTIEAPVAQATTSASNCVPGQIEISAPTDGQEVSGIIEVIGTANIENFGFYKYEMKRPDEDLWATIQIGNVVQVNNKLGDWDTRNLSPGEYQLGLVLVDNQGRSTPSCVVKVFVIRAPEGTPNP